MKLRDEKTLTIEKLKYTFNYKYTIKKLKKATTIERTKL